MDSSCKKNLAIVLFGKTGNGKSSVGNTILSSGHSQGRFTVGSGLASTTDQIEQMFTKTEDTDIEVIDIPDFINLEGAGDQIKSGIRSLKIRLNKNPYVVLLAVRCDVRYTQEEYDIYKEFKKLWGEEICSHLIVAFTFGDRQDHDLDRELKIVNPELKSLLKDAGQRRVLFDDRGDNERQIKKLRQIIQELHNGNKVIGGQQRRLMNTDNKGIEDQPSSLTKPPNQNTNSEGTGLMNEQEDCCKLCFK